jgi:CDP-paratose 2-epimerase
MTLSLSASDREITRRAGPAGSDEGPVVITGGAGFVGCNLAARLLEEGRRVLIYDNISRLGVRRNVAWLRERFGNAFELQVADVRDYPAVLAAVSGARTIFHCAAQVAVTTSFCDPIEDFCINASGTLNVIEAARAQARPPAVIFTSTNKVYGDLADLRLERTGTRYEPLDDRIAAFGIGEERTLDFHSPYGCSKGAADQYVRDYARSYGLDTVVFRMSCIYGPRQFGTEDQGWLAHFLIRALDDEPLVLYGDGGQVRDALFVDDLVDALIVAERNAARLSGEAYNIGGGPANTTSLLELLERIEVLSGRRPAVLAADWRAGDQRYFVADTSRFREATGWAPEVALDDGIERLYEWLLDSRRGREAFAAAQPALLLSHAIGGRGVAARPLP